MSKTTIRLLAVSALALNAGFIGFNQASAFSLDSGQIILAQAGGTGSTGAGGSGGAGSSADQQSGGPATGNSPGPGGEGAGTSIKPDPGHTKPATPPAASPSAGVPAQCAAMTNASERAACVERNQMGTRK